MGRSTAKNVVGLDIQPGYVAAVQSRNGVAVERAAMAPLAPGVVRDGEISDVETLASVLRDLFAEHKLAKRVRLGVANQRIVMRTLDLPPLQGHKEIASAVRFQAQDHIPMPLDQAVLEYQSLGTVETAEGPRTRVVVVAARRDMIERQLEAVKRAGLRAHGIDLSAFAMIRALHQPGSTDPILYVAVGGITNLAVAIGTTCVFTRVVAHGTETMATELAERRQLTLEHAHAWLRHVGLVTPVEQIDGDTDIVAEAREVLQDGTRRIADEVRNSIDFHMMQVGSTGVERAVLTGPAVAIPGLSEELSELARLPMEVGTVSEARPGALGDIDAGRLAVAAGLTVEEVTA
ncbi:MAG TPA: type IV pilus assembly protein PilM [Candidatus Limnocylindria bacterium]|nr:type IV pilus assembly protein PilM [Candidatus Limnocylindria bacterium]